MATLVPAIKLLCEGMAHPRAKMSLGGRTMREDDDVLVPRDPIGRNKATHLSPSHILNLMIAAAAADPIAGAPNLVRAYRQARYQTPFANILDETLWHKPILSGRTLGHDLEILIDLLATSSARERLIRKEFSEDFRVTLVVGEALVATVERPSQNRVDEYDAKGLAEPPAPQNLLLHGRIRRIVPMRRIVHLDFSYFEIAAELWADSLAHGVTYQPSLLEPLHATPEDENAASPGREAASVDDQDRKAAPGTSTPPKVGERKKLLKPHATRGLAPQSPGALRDRNSK